MDNVCVMGILFRLCESKESLVGKGIKEDSMSRKTARGYTFTYRFLEWNHWRIEKVKLP